MQAAVRRPPFDPPRIANLLGEVKPSLIRYSAAAMKSSYEFCLFEMIPALCHSSPYSPLFCAVVLIVRDMEATRGRKKDKGKPSADIGDRVDSVEAADKVASSCAECRVERNVESSITVQNRGVVSIKCESLC